MSPLHWRREFTPVLTDKLLGQSWCNIIRQLGWPGIPFFIWEEFFQTILVCVAGSAENLPSRGAATLRPLRWWRRPTTRSTRRVLKTSLTRPKTSSPPCWRKTAGLTASSLIFIFYWEKIGKEYFSNVGTIGYSSGHSQTIEIFTKKKWLRTWWSRI